MEFNRTNINEKKKNKKNEEEVSEKDEAVVTKVHRFD